MDIEGSVGTILPRGEALADLFNNNDRAPATPDPLVGRADEAGFDAPRTLSDELPDGLGGRR
jgi:hypothetical protein